MRPLPLESRIHNYTGIERCDRCLNDGFVVVAAFEHQAVAHPLTPGYGPCPFCEIGFRREFGLGKDKEGKREIQSERPAWGREGYWQGHDAEAEPMPRQDGRVLFQRENQLRMELLKARQAGSETADPLLMLGAGELAERLLRLEAHLAEVEAA